MDLGLKDKVAIVTGAGGGGIGTTLCSRLAREGAWVVANDIDRSWANKVAEELRSRGAKAVPTYADVTKLGQCQEMVQKALAEFGQVDILVTIPAYMEIKMFVHYTPEACHKQVDVTFWGVVNAVRAVLEPMTERRKGSIVLMGSDSAKMATAMETMYASAKAAIMTFASSLSKEVGPYSIRVNVVNAALVRTPSHGPGMEEAFAANYPLGRLAESEEVVEGIVFLASDRASFITGQTLSVNGGRL